MSGFQSNTVVPGCPTAWPALKYEEWKDTLHFMHFMTQIVGKIRLQLHPWMNHSWHTTLYVSPRGFGTGPIPYGNGVFEIEFDFIQHCLVLISTFQEDQKIELKSESVASFYGRTMDLLKANGIEVSIYARPNEMEDNTPFNENSEERTYDGNHARNFWQALISIHNVFYDFRSHFLGKVSPVHLFWGAFDLAVTRFSGKDAPLHPGGMPNMPLDVMQEAYSKEVSSVGFWPGSPEFPQAIFYAYCYPSPEAFAQQPIKPEQAFWSSDLGEYVLLYDDVINSEDPEKTLMDFLETTYVAAAETGDWDRKALERS